MGVIGAVGYRHEQVDSEEDSSFSFRWRIGRTDYSRYAADNTDTRTPQSVIICNIYSIA